MSTSLVDHTATLWLVDDIPSRMIYAGRRWRVTDMPTRLRYSSWTVPLDHANRGLYGWRFQGTDDTGRSLVFDVFKDEDGWHVHRIYD